MRDVPVSTLWISTPAFGIPAPDGSFTMPRRPAPTVWDKTASDAATKAPKTRTTEVITSRPRSESHVRRVSPVYADPCRRNVNVPCHAHVSVRWSTALWLSAIPQAPGTVGLTYRNLRPYHSGKT